MSKFKEIEIEVALEELVGQRFNKETLEAKLRLIENVANGSMKMDSQQVTQLINQTKKIREQIYDLVSVER